MLCPTIIFADPYQQDAGIDGIVSIETENFDTTVSQGGHNWTTVTLSGNSGTGAMQSTPNNGANINSGYVINSPRLDFAINFVKTGIHYVWIRGRGPASTDDSVHAGLDGVALSSSDRIASFGASWGWLRTTMDSIVATINVTTTGVHTLNLWMREDGAIVDKIVLTTSNAFTPTGAGPSESPRITPGTSGIITISPSIKPGDLITITVTDADLNSNALTAETVIIPVLNDVTFESESLLLTETGIDTGVFENTLATVFGASAGANDDGILNTRAGDTVTAGYDDALTNSGETATVTDMGNVTGGTNGVIAITPAIIPGDTLTVTTTDSDLNINASSVEAVVVLVINDVTSESETLLLTETGVDTGIFENSLATVFGTTAGSNDDGILNTQISDTITATYNDTLISSGNTATVTATCNVVSIIGHDGIITITPVSVPGNTLTVTVTDADLNTNTSSNETVAVLVINDVTSENETLLLTETGVDTGVFENTLATVFGTTAGSNDDGILNTQAGDTVTASYNDSFTSTGETATVTDIGNVIGGTSGTLTVTAANIESGDPLTITVTDADLNDNALSVETVTVSTVNDITTENESLLLAETGVNTGIFTNTLTTVFGTAAGIDNDGVLNAQAGNTITASYIDTFTTTGGISTLTAAVNVINGPGPYQQDSGSNGIVSIEAEHFDAKISQGGHDWTLATPAGSSGTGAMQTTPNTNTNINTGYTANSPRLDFAINFVKTGTHYVWIRGQGATDSDDSLHAGLDGVALASSDRITSSSNSTWTWSRNTMDSVVATINVATTGLHTLNLWMREDGLIVDKIVLTTSKAFTPTGTGPAESPRLVMELPFTDNFDALSPEWKVVDQTSKASNWTGASGQYQQLNRVQTSTASIGSYHQGTYAYLQTGIALSDYKFSVIAQPQPIALADDIGVMFRYQNPQNYYRYSLNSRFGTSRLEKRVGGTFTPLATNSRGFTNGQSLEITIIVSGTKILVFLNNDPVFSISDSSLTTGTVALYTEEKAVFDNVRIDPIPPASIIALSAPIAYSVNNTDTINASAIALNEPANSYMEFILDGVNPSIIDTTSPYSASFTGVVQGNHTIEAKLYNPSGIPLSQDSNSLVGRGGDYYIAIGDSITNGTGDHYASDNILQSGLIISFESYQATLTELLNNSLGYPNIVVNEGIGGDESADAAFIRINSILTRQSGANRTLIQLGTNDSGSLIPSGLGCSGTACNGTYKGNMQSLINTVTAAGKQAWVALVPPAFSGSNGVPFANPATATRNTTYIQAYNQVITTQLTNINIGPNFYSYFLGAGTNRFSLFDDTLHPNALGYVVMAYLWHNSLNPSAPVALPFILDNLAPTTGAPYLKQSLIESGDNYYIDEPTFTITNNIPAELPNGRWIMTANAGKSNTTANYVSFNVDRAVTVYIAYDAGATTLPAWMSGYTNTGLTLQTTDPLSPVLNLYSMSFGAGPVVLGGNLQSPASGADSNYIAIVVEN